MSKRKNLEILPNQDVKELTPEQFKKLFESEGNSIQALPAEPEEALKKTKEELFSNPEMEVNEKDLLDFFDTVILQNENWEKVYKLGKGTKAVDVVLRTRSGTESNEISNLLDKLTTKNPESTFEAVRHLLDLNLGYSLVSIGGTVYDNPEVNLKTRCAIIDQMPSVKKQMLWNMGEHFDHYVDEMRKQLVNL